MSSFRHTFNYVIGCICTGTTSFFVIFTLQVKRECIHHKCSRKFPLEFVPVKPNGEPFQHLLKKEEKLMKKYPAKALTVWFVFSVYLEKFIKALIMAEYKYSSSCKFGGNITYNIVGLWIFDDVLFTFFDRNQRYVKKLKILIGCHFVNLQPSVRITPPSTKTQQPTHRMMTRGNQQKMNRAESSVNQVSL